MVLGTTTSGRPLGRDPGCDDPGCDDPGCDDPGCDDPGCDDRCPINRESCPTPAAPSQISIELTLCRVVTSAEVSSRGGKAPELESSQVHVSGV
jgi:hypothetical protein